MGSMDIIISLDTGDVVVFVILQLTILTQNVPFFNILSKKIINQA